MYQFTFNTIPIDRDSILPNDWRVLRQLDPMAFMIKLAVTNDFFHQPWNDCQQYSSAFRPMPDISSY
jgi:hypothetical protein